VIVGPRHGRDRDAGRALSRRHLSGIWAVPRRFTRQAEPQERQKCLLACVRISPMNSISTPGLKALAVPNKQRENKLQVP
jgi:hypothetical protein